ncbi:hypothetical protein RDWZM_008164, partial [Blomia tropicalis]
IVASADDQSTSSFGVHQDECLKPMNNDATSSISVFALYTADRRKLVDDHDDDLSSRSLQQSFSQWMAISFVSYPIGIVNVSLILSPVFLSY